MSGSKPQEDVLGVADRTLEIVNKLGASLADIYVRSAANLSLEVRNGEVESVRRSESLGLGLRIMVDGRTVMVHTTDRTGVGLLKLIRQAMEMAPALPAPQEPEPFAGANLIDGMMHPDPELSSEPMRAKQERLVAVERAMLAVDGVTSSVSASYSESEGEIALANTRGLRLYTPFCRLGVYNECIAEREGEATTGAKYIAVSSRSRLPDPELIGRQAGEKAVSLLGAQPVASTKAPVIFTPETGWAVLRSLVPPVRGDYVVQQRSYLGDQIGEKIAADGVTIRDNALLRGGPGSRPFDGEGSPATDLAVIEGGVLRHFLTDLDSAAKLGVSCGGNATRESYDSRPEIGTSNFHLEPGTLSPQEIIRKTERGLVVSVLSGWWVGLSPTTDTFSSAAMGHWIENGEIVHPVRGITIGGTLREMLAGIDQIGNDLEFTAETRTPTFRVAEMAISGI